MMEPGTEIETTALCDRGEHDKCPGKTLRNPCACECHKNVRESLDPETACRLIGEKLGAALKAFEGIEMLAEYMKQTRPAERNGRALEQWAQKMSRDTMDARKSLVAAGWLK